MSLTNKVFFTKVKFSTQPVFIITPAYSPEFLIFANWNINISSNLYDLINPDWI